MTGNGARARPNASRLRMRLWSVEPCRSSDRCAASTADDNTEQRKLALLRRPTPAGGTMTKPSQRLDQEMLICHWI